MEVAKPPSWPLGWPFNNFHKNLLQISVFNQKKKKKEAEERERELIIEVLENRFRAPKQMV